MTEQSLEFRISQLADDALPVGDAEAVRAELDADPRARQTFAEYQRLQRGLGRALATPPVRWDALAAHLSAVVGESGEQAGVAGRIARSPVVWSRRIAVAASVLVVGGAGLLALHGRAVHRVETGSTAAVSSVVVGPQAQVARGTSSVQITVGPSPALAQQGGDWHYAEGVVIEPPKVQSFSKATPPASSASSASDDPHLH